MKQAESTAAWQERRDIAHVRQSPDDASAVEVAARPMAHGMHIECRRVAAALRQCAVVASNGVLAAARGLDSKTARLTAAN